MRILPAIMSASAADRAEAARCPGWMWQYCVLWRDGVEFVAWPVPWDRPERAAVLNIANLRLPRRIGV